MNGNFENGKFYVMCILPQFEKKTAEVELKSIKPCVLNEDTF